MIRRRTAWSTALVAVFALVAGCASIPTSGPIRSGSGVGDIADPPYGVQPQPPRPGSGARALINDFLDAMGGNASLDILRQYLTPEAAERWKPDNTVVVIDRDDRQSVQEGRTASGSAEVTLNAPRRATLTDRGAWQGAPAGAPPVVVQFRLARVDGELRITNPPSGRLVASDLFTTNYRPLNLYFFTPKLDALIPDPVYIPASASAAQTATVLAQALLLGPTPRLGDAVVSAAPSGTEAVSVTVDPDGEGVATVALNDKVDPLVPDLRLKLAAQLAWTLRQVSGVVKLRVTAGGQPYEIDTSTSEFPVNRFDSYDAAFASATGRRLYLLNYKIPTSKEPGPYSLGWLDTIDSSDAQPQRLYGLPTSGSLKSVAIDLDGRNAAVVSDGRVVYGPIGTTQPGRDDSVDVDTDGAVLRPSFDKDRNLWIVDRADGQARIRVRRESGTLITVQAPGLAGRPLTALRVARDGVRVLAIVGSGTDSQLVTGRITGTDRTAIISALQPIQVGFDQIVDAGWSRATKIMVLGRTGGTANQLIEANVDGSEQATIAGNSVQAFNPMELAVAPDADALPTVRNTDRATGAVLVRERDLSWFSLNATGDPVYPG